MKYKKLVTEMIKRNLNEEAKSSKYITWDVVYDILQDKDNRQFLVNDKKFFNFMVKYILNDNDFYSWAVDQYNKHHSRNSL